jgi:1,4-alpha-glucan branching enzyme
MDHCLVTISDAKEVYLAGDFNDWTSNALKLTRLGDAWVFNVHLSVGKHLYKFIVDGHWIRDPDNPLWEGRGLNSENSVLWMEEK